MDKNTSRQKNEVKTVKTQHGSLQKLKIELLLNDKYLV